LTGQTEQRGLKQGDGGEGMSLDLRQPLCSCCGLVRGDYICNSFGGMPGISVGEQFGHRLCPILLPCVRNVYVCVCVFVRVYLHTVDSWCAGCMWEQRESTWLRGESQTQVIALTFTSNEGLGR